MKRYELDNYKSEIINLYINKNMPCSKIANEINSSLSGIYDALKRWGIKTRSLSDSHKVYYLNENYFEKIDTEEKAYWLGFIYADGYITGDKLGISLAKCDKEHLEKFLKCIKSDYKIKEYKSKSIYGECEYCRVLLNSTKLVEDLREKGVLNNKSLKLTFPNNEIIDTSLYNHFIRGYFDGDGSLVLSKNSINFKICGTKEFLEGLIDVFNTVIYEYNYQKKLFKRHMDDKNNYYISYGGRVKTLKVIDYLYNDCNIYLNRKYNKYIELKSTF